MYYQIEKLDGFYRIGSPEAVFSYLICGTEQAMLIDTGYGLGDLRSVVEQITPLPLVIVNTHGHCDHVGGNAQFSTPCYMYPADWELAREHCSSQMRRMNAERLAHSLNYETGEEFSALPEAFELEAYAQRGTGDLIEAHEGMRFDLGGVTLELIETPGHTAGGISVLWREKRLLFVGDAVNFFTWLFAPESTGKKSYLAMLDKVETLPADRYLGGHNPAPMDPADLALFRRAALEADYDRGEPFVAFIAPELPARVCPVDGMTMADMFKPGFAAVVIAPNWHIT